MSAIFRDLAYIDWYKLPTIQHASMVVRYCKNDLITIGIIEGGPASIYIRHIRVVNNWQGYIR
jgi:hypothetical protein